MCEKCPTSVCKPCIDTQVRYEQVPSAAQLRTLIATWAAHERGEHGGNGGEVRP